MTSSDLLSGATILVLGAGGLGAHVLKQLALAGVGHIHIVDLDILEMSNLNRQILFRSVLGESGVEI